MADHFRHRDTLLDRYQQLQDHPFPGSDEAELAALAGDAQRLREEVFKIAFIGRFSVGKSQLINRLFLGEDVLTVNLKPTTAHLMRIGYGPQPALWLLPSAEGDANKSEGVKREALVPPGGDVAAIAEAIRHHTTHLGKPRSGDASLFQLDWPNGQFFRDGVQLLDTIGTEDIDDQFIKETYAAIRQSDAVVMILSMLQPLTASEQGFIDQHLKGTGKKVFLVVNKADGRSPEEQREILDDLRHRFSARYRDSQVRAEDRIFPVSAKRGDGLNELRERLVQFVTEERLTEILRGHGEGLRLRLKGWSLGCQRALADHQQKKDGQEQKLRETQKQLRLLAEGLEQDRNRLDDIHNDLEGNLHARISDLRRKGDRLLRDFQAQASSVEIMTTDFGMFFKNEATEVTDYLQRRAAQQLQKRLAAMAGIDAQTIEKIASGSGNESEQIIDTLLTASGGSSLVAGGLATLSALTTALATPIPWWAAGTSTMTVFAGALVPWAIPAIIGGIFLIWGRDAFKRKWREQARIKFLNDASRGFDQACTSLESGLKKQLHDYVTQAWGEAEQRIARDRQALEQLIAETDLSVVEAGISALRDEGQRLTDVSRQLDNLLAEVS